MARRIIQRTAVLSGVDGATSSFTIPSTMIPVPRPGFSLVGLALVPTINGTSAFVGTNIGRVRLTTDSDKFYDQLWTHERQWQARFCYRGGAGPLNTDGVTTTAFVGAGAYQIWLNDQRAMTSDYQDLMAAPLNEQIALEIVTNTDPAGATAFGVQLIYSDVTPIKRFHRLSTVLNIGASSIGATRDLQDGGNYLALGLPHLSLTATGFGFSRWRTTLANREIHDLMGPQGALISEVDDSDWYAAPPTAAADAVLWKSTRGNELPGGSGSYVTVDSVASLTSTEMPYWTSFDQRK